MNESPIRLDWSQLLGFDQSRAVVDGTASVTAAKVGSKDPVYRTTLPLGLNLDAKVGEKNPGLRSETYLPVAIAAKVGLKGT